MNKPARKPYTRQPDSNRPGRPCTVTEELQQLLVDHLEAGGTITDYCQKHKHVSKMTVFNFMARESGEKFREAVHRARENGTHALAEQCIAIVDDPDVDPLRARIRADVRLRLAAQWNRKIYGPKQDIDVTARLSLGDLVDAAIKHAASSPPMLDVTPPAQLAARYDAVQQNMDAVRTRSEAAPAPATAAPVDQPARRATRRTAS